MRVGNNSVLRSKSFFASFFSKKEVLLPLLVFLSFCLLHHFFLPLYLFFTAIPDGVRKPVPFVDLHDILLAGACWRHGVDVYTPSACMHGGVFNYSPFFLRLLPFGPRDTLLGGVLMALGFFASLLLLPKQGGGWRLAGVLSPAVYYGIEQANFDIVIFVMTVVGVVLRRRAGCFAYAVFGLAAALKFYPIALFVTVLREPRRRFIALAGLGAAIGLIFLVVYGEGVRAAIHVLPSGTPFRATFGRIDLARGLNWLHILTARRVDALTGPVFTSGEAVAQALSWVMSAAAIAASALLARRRGVVEPFLLAGSAVTVFCFYAAQNVEYRAVFLLLTLPALARSTRWLRVAVLVLLWEAAIRACLPVSLQLGFWLLREALWWWVVIELGAVVLAFVTAEVARLRREGLLKIDAGRKNP